MEFVFADAVTNIDPEIINSWGTKIVAVVKNFMEYLVDKSIKLAKAIIKMIKSHKFYTIWVIKTFYHLNSQRTLESNLSVFIMICCKKLPQGGLNWASQFVFF